VTSELRVLSCVKGVYRSMFTGSLLQPVKQKGGPRPARPPLKSVCATYELLIQMA